MHKLTNFLFIIILILSGLITNAQNRPLITFNELLLNAEENIKIKTEARAIASKLELPWSIYLEEGIFIEALTVENNKPVYLVVTDMLNPYNGGYTAFFDEIQSQFDLNDARIHYSKTNVLNPHLGFPEPLTDNASASFLLFVESTGDRVITLDINTGDPINMNYIPSDPVNLATPIQARLTPWGNITISEQINDGVYQYDTLGAVLGIFAPAGGINTTILDNVRGHNFRNNTGNLVVAVAAGGNINSISEFDSQGNFIGQFITSGSGGLDSPYDILFRTNDVIVSASTSDMLHRYDLNGNFISNLYTGVSANFFQQMQELPNGDILVADFGVGGGVRIFSSTGTLLNTLGQITAIRGVYKLGNGNILVSNAAGLFEINPVTGDTLRQIIAGVAGRFITPYDPSIIPVELSSFTAMVNGSNVTLNWMTASEVNNMGFDLERRVHSPQSSVGNFEYERIGFVEGKGTSTGVSTYSFTDQGLSTGVYNYRIKQIDFDGTFKYYDLSESVEIGVPDRFELAQNYPNPFNPNTVISYQLPVSGFVSLKVFDLLGNEVTTLVNEYKPAGMYEVEFDASVLTSGVYFYVLRAGEYTQTKKMILLR